MLSSLTCCDWLTTFTVQEKTKQDKPPPKKNPHRKRSQGARRESKMNKHARKQASKQARKQARKQSKQAKQSYPTQELACLGSHWPKLEPFQKQTHPQHHGKTCSRMPETSIWETVTRANQQSKTQTERQNETENSCHCRISSFVFLCSGLMGRADTFPGGRSRTLRCSTWPFQHGDDEWVKGL